MSAKFVEYRGVQVQRGSALYEALEAKDNAKAAQLHADCERQAKARGEVTPEYLRGFKVGLEPAKLWKLDDIKARMVRVRARVLMEEAGGKTWDDYLVYLETAYQEMVVTS